MKYSENYHLYLPDGSDYVSPEQFNDNFKTLDAKLKAVETEAGKVVGHTHGAEEIVSGIFDWGRIPIVPEGNQVVATIGPYTHDGTLYFNGQKVHIDIPFQVALDGIPERVWMFFMSGTQDELDTKPYRVNDTGAWASIDMSYQSRFYTFLNAWVEGCAGRGDKSPTYLRRFVRDIRNKDIFKLSGSSTTEGKWTEFGGMAFMPSTQTDAGKSVSFRVSNFEYDNSKIGFDIIPSNYTNPAGQRQSMIFTAYGFAFKGGRV